MEPRRCNSREYAGHQKQQGSHLTRWKEIRGQSSGVRSLALELQMIVGCLMDAGNQTQILYMKGKTSQLRSHLSSPSFNILLAYIHYR